MTDREPLNHLTEQIEKGRVDAALEALGLTTEYLDSVSEVHITPKTVTISIYDRNDAGNLYILRTKLGNTIAMGVREYKIVPDGTGESLDDVAEYQEQMLRERNGTE